MIQCELPNCNHTASHELRLTESASVQMCNTCYQEWRMFRARMRQQPNNN